MAQATPSFSVESSELFPVTEFSRTLPYMTTVFTPAPECTGRALTGDRDYFWSSGTIMWDSELYPGITLSCSDRHRPTVLDSTAFNFVGAGGDDARYAVGVCPEGYSTVGTRVPTAYADTYYSYDTAERTSHSTVVSKTHAWCCPPGFTRADYNEIDYRQPLCESFVSTGTVISVTSVGILSDTSSIFTTTTSSFTAYDRGYFVSWNALQLPHFTPSSAPVLNIADKSIASLPQSVTKTQTATITGNSGGSGGGGGGRTVVVVLAPKAIAGIVIGVAVAVGVIGYLFWHCCMKLRRRKPVEQVTVENVTAVPKV